MRFETLPKGFHEVAEEIVGRADDPVGGATVSGRR
jgi:hypothetical protein